MKVQVELEIQMPKVAEYLRTNPDNDYLSIQIGDLSETQLEEFLKKLNQLYREKWNSQKLENIVQKIDKIETNTK